MNAYRLLFLCSLVSFCLIISTESTKDAESIIQELLKEIESKQVKHGTSFIPPLVQEEKVKGLYPSYIHLNYHGSYEKTLLRHYFKFFDNNMFVTNWVSQALLELNRLNISGGQMPPSQMEAALIPLLGFRDKNHPPDVPIYCFWQQVLKNGTWVAWPTNIAEPLQGFATVREFVISFLKTFHLDFLIPFVENFLGETANFLTAFVIPSDTDDSSVNLALGALLLEQKDFYPEQFAAWQKNNAHIGKLLDLYTKYAYRPFSSDIDANTIDPRTFFWLRDFLFLEEAEAKKKNQTADTRLISTWLVNLSEDRDRNKLVHMPFNTNNVDATVCANSIYGITKALLTGLQNPKDWFSSDVEKLYFDTSKLIAWGITSGMVVSRPDLALLYYPPTYDFFWFVSRTVFELNSVPLKDFPPTLSEVKRMLTLAMREEGTKQLLKESQVHSENPQWIFWDEFLGVNDTFFGRPVNRAEDRLFSTSMAVNALMDSWTVSDDTCKLVFIPTVPTQVKQTIENAVKFLRENILTGELLKENSFFSGSMKGISSLPFAYPANFRKYLNGTVPPPNPPPNAIDSDLINGMSGMISKEDYDQLIEERHFGIFPTPMDFKGYNIPDSSFPYWSSPSLTDAVAALAIGKHSYLTRDRCE